MLEGREISIWGLDENSQGRQVQAGHRAGERGCVAAPRGKRPVLGNPRTPAYLTVEYGEVACWGSLYPSSSKQRGVSISWNPGVVHELRAAGGLCGKSRT